MTIVKEVDAFRDEAYMRTWNSLGHVIGPVVRVRLPLADIDDMVSNHRPRHFTREDGLMDGWYCAHGSGSNADPMGGIYSYAIVAPCAPPKDAKEDGMLERDRGRLQDLLQALLVLKAEERLQHNNNLRTAIETLEERIAEIQSGLANVR